LETTGFVVEPRHAFDRVEGVGEMFKPPCFRRVATLTEWPISPMIEMAWTTPSH